MARGAKKYLIPLHLSKSGISQEDFGRWLDRVTAAHVRRDRKRSNKKIVPERYRLAIFRAICDGGDRDYYTGEALDWCSLQYFSKTSQGRADEVVPTLDHDGLNPESPVFRICSLRTNKCKSDYTVEQLLKFCRLFVKHQEDLTAGFAAKTGGGK